MSKKQRFMCTVDPSADLAAVERALRAAGITVEQRLEAISTLVISGDAATVKAAGKIRGVTGIEPEGRARTQD